MANTPISPARVAKDYVLAKCDYFVDIQLWPIETRINPSRWLENFEPSEMDHAVHLLSAFTYYSGTLVKELFKAAFQSISRTVVPKHVPYIQGKAKWKQFRSNVLVGTCFRSSVPSSWKARSLSACFSGLRPAAWILCRYRCARRWNRAGVRAVGFVGAGVG